MTSLGTATSTLHAALALALLRHGTLTSFRLQFDLISSRQNRVASPCDLSVLVETKTGAKFGCPSVHPYLVFLSSS